jgi:hypothetical protein
VADQSPLDALRAAVTAHDTGWDDKVPALEVVLTAARAVLAALRVDAETDLWWAEVDPTSETLYLHAPGGGGIPVDHIDVDDPRSALLVEQIAAGELAMRAVQSG